MSGLLRILSKLAVVVACGTLGACASIIDGTSQTITIDSVPQEANCRLMRDGRLIGSVATPNGIVVEKTKHDIHLTCKKDGYQDASAILTSNIESATFGNIILGGGIGWAIDSASGADNKYEEAITVTLVPVVPAAATASSPASAPPLVQANIAPAEPAPERRYEWQTNGAGIRAHAQPDETSPSIAMPPDIRMALLQTDRDWSLFEYKSANGAPAHAWIKSGSVVRVAG